jgi:hypothetical protein
MANRGSVSNLIDEIQLQKTSKMLCKQAMVQDIHNVLMLNWKLENPAEAEFEWSKEELFAKKTFNKTTIKGKDNKYIVRFLFIESPETLGDTLQIALKRLAQTERQIARQPKLGECYQEFISEYKRLGHLAEVNQDDLKEKFPVYLPHHKVIRESSSTTKLHVVFDASAKSSNLKSLNNIIAVGPIKQESLLVILLRF